MSNRALRKLQGKDLIIPDVELNDSDENESTKKENVNPFELVSTLQYRSGLTNNYNAPVICNHVPPPQPPGDSGENVPGFYF